MFDLMEAFVGMNEKLPVFAFVKKLNSEAVLPGVLFRPSSNVNELLVGL